MKEWKNGKEDLGEERARREGKYSKRKKLKGLRVTPVHTRDADNERRQ